MTITRIAVFRGIDPVDELVKLLCFPLPMSNGIIPEMEKKLEMFYQNVSFVSFVDRIEEHKDARVFLNEVFNSRVALDPESYAG